MLLTPVLSGESTQAKREFPSQTTCTPRPAWTTGTLIPASFLCAIGAAIFIWRGGAKTKKVAQVEERLREALEVRIHHA
jgi:hypothetical protein